MANTYFRLYAIAALCFLCTSALAERSSRILDGDDVASAKYPWAVSVRVDNIHSCGGSIIAAKYVLTAGHCVVDIAVSRLSVRVGSTNQYAGGSIVNIASKKVHPAFGNFLNDLAILELEKPLTWSQKVSSIDLAAQDDVIEDDASVIVAGWGLLKTGATPYKMQESRFNVLSRADCELECGFGYNSTLCLKRPVHNGFCNGDLGAGCVSGDKLVGVASFVFGNCGTQFPDVAMLVSYAREWINSIIA